MYRKENVPCCSQNTSKYTHKLASVCLCACATLFKGHLVVITDSIWSITIEHNITFVLFYNLSRNYCKPTKTNQYVERRHDSPAYKNLQEMVCSGNLLLLSLFACLTLSLVSDYYVCNQIILPHILFLL